MGYAPPATRKCRVPYRRLETSAQFPTVPRAISRPIEKSSRSNRRLPRRAIPPKPTQLSASALATWCPPCEIKLKSKTYTVSETTPMTTLPYTSARGVAAASTYTTGLINPGGYLFASRHSKVGGGHLLTLWFDRPASLILCHQRVTLCARLAKVLHLGKAM